MNAKEAIELYQLGKTKKAALDAEYKAKCAVFEEKFAKIEEYLRQTMNEMGVDSIRTDAGTCYMSTRCKVSCPDKDAFLTYVRQNDFYELLDARPLKSAIQAYLEEHGQLPPGLDMTRERVVNIRKS